MMIFFVLVGVLLFVLGVTFLFKGYGAIPASDTIVPLEDLEKVKKDLDGSKNEGNTLKKQLDTLTVELVQTKSKLQMAVKAQDNIKELQTIDQQNKAKILELDAQISSLMTKMEAEDKEADELINILKKQNEDFQKQLAEVKTVDPQAAEQLKTEKEALAKSIETQITKIQQLETDLAASQTLQGELTSLKTTVETLSQDNEKLKQDFTPNPAEPMAPPNDEELAKTKQILEQVQQQLDTLQTESSQKETKIQELEKELQSKPTAPPPSVQTPARSPNLQIDKELARMHKEGEEQLVHSSAKIESLLHENQDISKHVKALGLEILRLENDIGRFRQEKERDDASRSLEREMELKRLCNDLKLQLEAMGGTIEGLKNENKSLVERQRNLEQGIPAQKESMTVKHLLADMQRLESNSAGQESWSQEKKQLEQHLRQLKDFNTNLLEKEKMIQMELTKSRTQAKGLEKICEEFKRQLEKSSRS